MCSMIIVFILMNGWSFFMEGGFFFFGILMYDVSSKTGTPIRNTRPVPLIIGCKNFFEQTAERVLTSNQVSDNY
jgi:hypothetical protein